MHNKKITIWVYDDEGVSETSMLSALSTFQKKLPQELVISTQPISALDIINGALNTKGCLIIPGGADLPYCEKLNGLGNKIIRDFIAEGNIYIGICAGGYYAACDIEFAGKGYNIDGSRELKLFPGKAIGSIASLTDGRLYDDSTASKTMTTLNFEGGRKSDFYYHGGPYFVSDSDTSFDIIAQYSNGESAIVSGKFEKGHYILSGVHFELCANIYESKTIATCKDGMEKEKEILSAINMEGYGLPLYDYIATMIKDVLT